IVGWCRISWYQKKRPDRDQRCRADRGKNTGRAIRQNTAEERPREDAGIDTHAVDRRPPADPLRWRLTPKQAERQRPACDPDAIEHAADYDERKCSERDEDRPDPIGDQNGAQDAA